MSRARHDTREEAGATFAFGIVTASSNELDIGDRAQSVGVRRAEVASADNANLKHVEFPSVRSSYQ